jgi:ketosteroid isomerase-like protein
MSQALRWTFLSFLGAAAACSLAHTRPPIEADRAALLAADARFDADVAERGIDAWIAWFEPNATSWNGKELVHDREVYRTTMGPFLSKPGAKMRWQPGYAEVQGDLGFTTGRWQLIAGSDGRQDKTPGGGHYVTVWRRQADGGWKIVFDMGNDDR